MIATEIGNPPQLWQTYQALGLLFEQLGQRDQARSAYASALRVIDEVANRLQDQELQRTLLAAPSVQELRAVAGGLRITGRCRLS
jgi:tetratricopeptide (TPR) repeat protein